MVVALTLFGPPAAQGQDAGEAAAKALNPLSDIWSMQNQTNFNKLAGGPFPQAEWQFVNNFQPIMPVPLGNNTNLINRFVVPYSNNPFLDPDTGTIKYKRGLGDIVGTFTIAPPPVGHLQLGAGFTFQAPTSSDIRTGAGLWQFGPAGVAVFKTKKFLCGIFPQHWESVGGTDALRPPTRNTNIQYFAFYFLTPTLTVGMSPNILIDWTKEEKNRYTVPIGIGVSYTTIISKIPVKFQAEYQHVVKFPEDIPGQRQIFRITVTPVIPNPFAKKD